MYKKFFKVILDILISLLTMPLLIIIIIVVGTIIYLDDKGPIFYNAKRLGKNGKVFKMYKFRTMKVNAEDLRNPDGSTFNSEDDPRLTRVGKFLRKTSIDEFPQILNVLLQNMSIVGPRPDLPEHIHLYSKEEKEKLSVLPGITGYSQAYYRNSIEWKERLAYDMYYSRNVSFLLDIKIVFKTVQTVVMKKNVFIDKKTVERSEEKVARNL